jgi:hypothetical protein
VDYEAWGWGHSWDVAVTAGGMIIAADELPTRSNAAGFEFELESHVKGVEVRTFLGRMGELVVNRIQIERI